MEWTVVKQSPHTSWKGHDYMCTNWKHKGHGDAYRILGKVSVLKQFGKRKRLNRHDVPERDEW
jgi:hypothetical protein